MDPAELVKQPQDVTENPYRRPAKGGQKEWPAATATAEVAASGAYCCVSLQADNEWDLDQSS